MANYEKITPEIQRDIGIFTTAYAKGMTYSISNFQHIFEEAFMLINKISEVVNLAYGVGHFRSTRNPEIGMAAEEARQDLAEIAREMHSPTSGSNPNQ